MTVEKTTAIACLITFDFHFKSALKTWRFGNNWRTLEFLNTQPDSVLFRLFYPSKSWLRPCLVLRLWGDHLRSWGIFRLFCCRPSNNSVVFLNRSFLRLTTGSIGSEEEFNMANGDASSSDSAPSVTHRPALQQFRRQKEQAAVEGKWAPRTTSLTKFIFIDVQLWQIKEWFSFHGNCGVASVASVCSNTHTDAIHWSRKTLWPLESNTIFESKVAQLSTLIESTIFMIGLANFGIVHCKQLT